MNIVKLNESVILPTKATSGSGAFDIYMPTHGVVPAASNEALFIKLGFACEIMSGHVGLMVPRSGVGAKQGLSLNNTIGVIDSDYRGEWVAALRNRNASDFAFNAGDRLLQLLVVPIADVELHEVTELTTTERGSGGLGSTGQ